MPLKTYLFSFALLLSVSSFAQTYTRSSVIDVGGTIGAASVGDYDNDDDYDLLVSGYQQNAPILKFFELEDGVFTEKIGTGLPGQASSAEWIDYDADGDLDVFAYHSDDTGTSGGFYINNDGEFSLLAVDIPKLRRGYFSVADYDNDGDPDLALAGLHGTDFQYTTYLITNTGTSFNAVATTIITAEGQHAWGDFDNDGDLDLVSPSLTNTVLYRNDDGSFVPFKSDFPVAVRGQSRWADFDKDGDLDLLLSGFSSSGSIAKIYLNEAGSFTEYTGVDLPGTEQGDTQWIDYDMDGDLDIFHSGIESNAGNIVKLYELQDGIYTEKLDHGFLFNGFGGVAFIDYDNDEDQDAIVLYENWMTRLYRNNLKSNPLPIDDRPGWPVDVSAHPRSTSEIELHWRNYDDNADGISIEMREEPDGTFSEVYVAGNAQNGTALIDNLSEGIEYTFRLRAFNGGGESKYSDSIVSGVASADLQLAQSVESGFTPYISSWADIDNDGDLDLLYGGEGQNLFLYENVAGTFSKRAHLLAELTLSDVDWADYDSDGDLDLLMAGQPPGAVNAKTLLMINTGDFTFEEYTGSPIQGVRNGFVRWVDANGDGYHDIILSGIVDPNIQVKGMKLLINQQDDTFVAQAALNIPTFIQGDIEIGDFDSDGKADFLLSGLKDTVNNFNVTATELYLNQGDEGFVLSQTFLRSYNAKVASGDFDTDGDLDIIVSGNESGTGIYLNNGGKFTIDSRNNLPTFSTNDIAVGDIDNDGDPDLVIGGDGYGGVMKSSVYLNDGTGIFTEGYYALGWSQQYVCSLADFDNDGDLDLFEGGQHFANILRNETATVNLKPEPPSLTAEAVAGGIRMIWNKANDDHTPTASLMSNVFVKKSDGTMLFDRQSNNLTGKLNFPAYGNAYLVDSIILQVEPGTYTVGVQSIDNSYSGSDYATADVTVEFIAPELVTSNPVACEESTFEVEVLGMNVVWYHDASLTAEIGEGNTLVAQVGRADTTVYAVQTHEGNLSEALEVTISVSKRITDLIIHRNDSLIAPHSAIGYQWFSGTNLLAGKTEQRLFAIEPAVYSVLVSNGVCPTDTITYVLKPSVPEVVYEPIRCVGDDQLVAATGASIKWYSRTGSEIGAESELLIPAVTISDTVVYVTQTINSVESDKLEVQWEVYPLPLTSVSLENGKLVASEGLSYQWYLNDVAISGATSRELTILEDGVYHVIVANQSCSTTSDPFLFTDIESPLNGMVFQHFYDGSAHIRPKPGERITRIHVFDAAGRMVLDIKDPVCVDDTYILNLQDLQPGIFLIRANTQIPLSGRIVIR